jgi:hypothetical protein
MGTRARRIRYLVRDENEARKLARENLRQRATAERGIGVAYQFRQCTHADGALRLRSHERS